MFSKLSFWSYSSEIDALDEEMFNCDFFFVAELTIWFGSFFLKKWLCVGLICPVRSLVIIISSEWFRWDKCFQGLMVFLCWKSLFCVFWDHDFCQFSSLMLSDRIFMSFAYVRSSEEVTMADLACWLISSFPSMPTCPGQGCKEIYEVKLPR